MTNPEQSNLNTGENPNEKEKWAKKTSFVISPHPYKDPPEKPNLEKNQPETEKSVPISNKKQVIDETAKTTGVSDEEFDKFVKTGNVSNEVLKKIADVIINGGEWDEKISGIYAEQAAKIKKLLEQRKDENEKKPDDSEETEGDPKQKSREPNFQVFPLSEKPDIKNNESENGDIVSETNKETSIENQKSTNKKITLDEIIKKAEEENLSDSEKEKFEKIKSALRQGENNIEQEAKEAGLQDKIRKIGEFYNKLPFKQKLIMGTLLGIGAGTLSGVAAAGCATALFSQRILGGAGTFVMIEGLLQRSAEKDGRERGKWEKRVHTIMATLSGVAVGSGGVNLLNGGISFLSDYFDPSALPVENPALDLGQETPVAPDNVHSALTEIPNETLTPEGINSPEIATPSIAEASIPQSDMTFTVGEETGTLWGGIEKTLQNQGYFNGLDEGRQTFLTDSIKDKFATMSPDELREIGISSGDIGLVHTGETIDLSSVLENTASIDKLAEQAGTLPDSVSDNIWAQEHPGEALSGNTVSEISSTPEVNVADNLSTNIENQNTSIESSFPETKITEGSPVLEPQPLEAHLLREDLNNLYGKLETNPNVPGSESAHWDGEKGLSGQTIKTISETNPNLLSSDGVGIESKEAVSATIEHIRNLTNEVRFTPKNNETIEEFFKKAYVKIAQ